MIHRSGCRNLPATREQKMIKRHYLVLLSIAIATLSLAACSGPTSKEDPNPTAEAAPEAAHPQEEAMADNPLLVKSTLPYGAPPFDLIKDEHYLPAFEEGMKLHLAEIDAIATNTEAPTFENTIVAIEKSGQPLERVDRIFSNLSSAHTNDTLKEVETTVAPLLSAHYDAIYLNGPLFDRVKALYEQRTELGLDAESTRLIERYYSDFVRAGALVSDADKEKLKAINAEVASLMTTVGQNILAETNDSAVLVEDLAELDGLSEDEINAASEAAKAAGHEGKYLLTLQNTTIQPILTNMKNRALRERVHRASSARGARDNAHDNRPLLTRLAVLRAERSKLLGFDTAAAYKLADQTAKTTEAVNEMMGRIAPAAVANAKKEAAEIQEIIKAEGGDFEVEAWDWLYYSEKVRQAKFDIDENELKPYFELETVLNDGVFYSANQLFGITMKERTDLPVYHPDVRVWEVIDADGKGIGIFYGDFYARDSKRGGAWMNQYTLQSGLLGNAPVVGNHTNIAKPPAGQPTLLRPREVETLYHEFGHALHGMLSQVEYPYFSGTNVPRDFVEFPSQVNEMWAFHPAVLANSARHYADGSQIPQELLDKVLAARTHNQGYKTTEYIEAAIIDQAWHQLPADQIPSDVAAFEAQVLKDSGLDFAPVPPRYHSTYFNHVFAGGYWSGYYAYIWAEVLDACTVKWYEDNGGLLPENGKKMRDAVLSRGGSTDAMELFLELTGAEPSIDPLLERRGLTGS